MNIIYIDPRTDEQRQHSSQMERALDALARSHNLQRETDRQIRQALSQVSYVDRHK
ncbi:hypothetical protein GRI33_07915 [Brucella sp. BO3]|uniref:hypothetical protein n=1 Tax=Brucella sp. BO3 TaxID=2691913 RepID=UPI0015F78147|nr:hypothetical protein [Brucella sp. BO3]QMV26845.1 hypothetical protein GRI33_07915 [Brucella sp. BO3]